MKVKSKHLLQQIYKARYLYLCILPMMLWIFVFQYGPMYGIIMAFKEFKPRLGIAGSPWVGLDNFELILRVPAARQAIINTLVISFGRLIFVFPMGIIVAILLSEMPGVRVKKICQTVLTFPHFLSWIVVTAIVTNFLSNDGVINSFLNSAGMKTVDFLGNPDFFRPLLYITNNWKEMGWSAIIYIAAIAGVDTTLYEAAEIDGASRLQRIFHITLPGIRTTIVVMLVLAVGGIMNAGFDQIYNLSNSLTSDVGRILDTYVYDITFGTVPNYGFSTAVGLLKAVVNLALILTANKIAQWIQGEKVFC